ncbi:VanW family protein [Modestobacter sp. VKM Ac-2979]|uniref:VanW family protein n=1 Tax=unclassified Modestobacter TaxID=2643866 RepID=UPI0022AB9B96|nr:MULTISPECIES: VanW family protein [unclassified Modestobacter]MCZ2814299.1 VanW family protein [Modestobacter sp. VKM Ac-2979]MCZ2844009.1 VanW family protein [Modestobacter sp. VKM Ac-2980]
MPQEPRGVSDTVRLQPDGTVGSSRPAPPAPPAPTKAGPADADPSAAAEPLAPAGTAEGAAPQPSTDAEQPADAEQRADAEQPGDPGQPVDTQPPADGEPSEDSPQPGDTQVIGPPVEADGPPPPAAPEQPQVPGSPTPAAETTSPADSPTAADAPVVGSAVEDTAVVPRVDTPAAGPADNGDAAHPTAPTGSSPAGAPSAPGGPPPTRPTGAGDDSDGSDGDGDNAPAWRRRRVLVPVAVLLTLGVLYGADLALAGGDVPRGTVVGGVDVSGLSPAAAAQRLEGDLAPKVAADHPVVADDVTGVLHPASAGIALDVPATVDAVDDQPLNPWTRLTSLFTDRDVDAVLTADETALAAQVEQLAATVDRAPVDATITLDGTEPTLVEPVDGRTLDRAGAAEAITATLAAGGAVDDPIELPVDVTEVQVAAEEAARVLEETVVPALSAPVTVVGPAGSESVEVPVTAIAASLTFTPQDDGTLAVAVDPATLQAQMGEAFGVFGSPAQDARFEVSGDTIAVVPSVDGQGINPAQLADQLLPVLTEPAPRTVTGVLGPVPASLTTEQAQALGITEKVSSFTTEFTNQASGTNIRVVAAEVDGALVRPGETFSLNGYTGPRGTAQGYVPAAVISGGELSKAVGGGISQFATTMFNTVFFAGLEDVYHKPHSFYISRYPAGREATVYEGQIDLKWRNDTDTGIYVQTEWTPSSLTVTFWGTKYYDIESISSERRNIREPAVQEKVDEGNCTPQSGSRGFDITVTRVFRDLASQAELRREDFETRYAAEAIIHCVPPPAPPADPAAADPAAGGAAPAGPPATTPTTPPPAPAG